VKDVVASHDALIQLFERIHSFLQRLKSYTGMPSTNESRELLGKIMAQLLLILALSTKAMTERRISELIRSPCLFLADYGSEKILKKLVGRTDVEDALLRLDILTKEESLMMAMRNLEVAHHVDDNVEATKVLVEDINDNVKGIEGVTRNVDNGTQHFLFVFVHQPNLFPILSKHSHT
jgi:hypothetical protein